jgi:hypothetical protein
MSAVTSLMRRARMLSSYLSNSRLPKSLNPERLPLHYPSLPDPRYRRRVGSVKVCFSSNDRTESVNRTLQAKTCCELLQHTEALFKSSTTDDQLPTRFSGRSVDHG